MQILEENGVDALKENILGKRKEKGGEGRGKGLEIARAHGSIKKKILLALLLSLAQVRWVWSG